MNPKPPQLNQIDLFPAKKRGGYRGAHRPKGEGSIVMRVPAGIADAVTKLITDYKLQTTNPIYKIEIDGGVYTWSGKGSIPMPFCNFIWRHPKKREELEKSGGNLKPVTEMKQHSNQG